jgi:hypothetical protein
VGRLAIWLLALLCAALFAAGPASAARPRIFVTGDSLMRGVDGALAEELAKVQDVKYLREVRIGSALTAEPWVRIARRQQAQYQPDATVMFMGANDGFNVRAGRCCGPAWVANYQERVTKMIRIYSRDGLAPVYWVTVPQAAFGRRTRIFPKINRAIAHAVQASGPHAHLVDTWPMLTPDGDYRRWMWWEGERVEVRNPDGVHLRGAGLTIVARLIRDAMLADGSLP